MNKQYLWLLFFTIGFGLPLYSMKNLTNKGFKKIKLSKKITQETPPRALSTFKKPTIPIQKKFIAGTLLYDARTPLNPEADITKASKEFNQPMIVEGEAVEEREPKNYEIKEGENITDAEIFNQDAEEEEKVAELFNSSASGNARLLKDDNNRWWLVVVDQDGKPDLNTPYEQQIFNKETKKFESDKSRVRGWLRWARVIRPSFKRSYSSAPSTPFAKDTGFFAGKLRK